MYIFINLVLAALVFTAGVSGAPAPSVTGITPDSGVRGTTVPITNLSGSGFLAGDDVTLEAAGYPNITMTEVSVLPTQINGTFVIPPDAPAGYRNVVVTDPEGGSAVLIDAFQVINTPPVISRIKPTEGVRGKTISEFVVRGSGFVKGARLRLTHNGSADVPVKIISRTATRITGRFTVPQAVGFWNIEVTQKGYEPGIKADAFHVLYPAPIINAVSPDIGVQGKTISPLNIRGSGFREGANATVVRSGRTPVPINITGIAPEKLAGNVTLPADMATGLWKVRVTQPDSKTGSKADAFTVLANGSKISITGLNLYDQYLTIKNYGMKPVVMTGWKITNGKGRSIKFIEYRRPDGKYYNFVLKPQTTVTIFYAKSGDPTDTELYFPGGVGMWSLPGDTAYLKNPEGELVSVYTA